MCVSAWRLPGAGRRKMEEEAVGSELRPGFPAWGSQLMGSSEVTWSIQPLPAALRGDAGLRPGPGKALSSKNREAT